MSADPICHRQDPGPPRDGPLAGLRLLVKDNLADAGQPLEAGSRLLRGHVAPYTATVVDRARRAGAAIIGRCAMDEFAMGSTGTTDHRGPIAHPDDPARIPGGSSGGCAAALAAGLAEIALASDTGGSTRQPAALCGVYGLKPTYGRLSRRGLVALASSTDVVGLMARRLDPLARLLDALSGRDPGDATSADPPISAVTPRRVGLVDPGPDVDPAIQRLVEAAAARLVAAGFTVIPLPADPYDEALEAYAILCAAEAASNLARYDGLRFGDRQPGVDFAAQRAATRALLGPAVQARIARGEALLVEGVRYAAALAQRATFAARLDAQLAQVDATLLPTSPFLAPRADALDPARLARADMYTVLASLTGHPALSLPIGRIDGLPVGAQLTGRRWGEPVLFALAGALT